MLLNFLISILTSQMMAQSFQEKPPVPVFQINGEPNVIVDCWDTSSNQSLQRHFLKSHGHPSIFQKQVSIGANLHEVEVNLLKSENTLTFSFPEQKNLQRLFTYGTELGYQQSQSQVYCSIFMGEINEN